MPATTKDILVDEDAVRTQVEEITEQRNVLRQAFREVDLSNANSETVYFVVPGDVDDNFDVVEEGADFPRDMADREKIPVTRDKYGEEYAITMEAERDGILDDVGIEAENKMNRLARTLEAGAWDVLGSNLNESGPVGSNSGTLTVEDLIDGEETLMDDPYHYEPDTIFVSPSGSADLKTSDELNTATEELASRTVREGFVGTILGMNVRLSTSGNIGDNTALMVDTTKYGREGVWQQPDTETYGEQRSQETVVQFWSMNGWAATQPNAAIEIQG